MRIVIVGGVAAGASAATRLRRNDETAEIILIEEGPKISFANCALPYFAGGVTVPKASSLLAATKERLSSVNRLDIRESTSVLCIDRARKTIRARDNVENKEFELSYDKLILATGAKPFMPPVVGLSELGHFLWTYQDAINLRALVDDYSRRDLTLCTAIIGGGAVGLETAENLWMSGANVTLIESGQTVMSRNSPEMSRGLMSVFRRERMTLKCGVSVLKAEPININGTAMVRLTLSDQSHVDVHRVVVAAGVRANTALAANAGITLGEHGAITVNGFMQTNDPDIYATGDCTECADAQGGKARPVQLAGPAIKEARTAADHIAAPSQATPYRGALGSNVIRLFSMTLATTGQTETQLLRQGLVPYRDYIAVLICARNHVAWFPGSNDLYLKICFTPDGRILGAEALGEDGADKRIDVIATAMMLKATISDLASLDLCYSPAISTPKDAVNTLGMVAGNVLAKRARFIGSETLQSLMRGESPYLGEKQPNTPDKVVLLDIREPAELQAFSLPYRVAAIPLAQLRSRMNELEQDKLIVVICRAGVRAHTASRILMQNGFKHVMILAGGCALWSLAYGDQ